MDKLKWSMGFKHGQSVDCVGKSGGMALWWRDGFDVTLRPWCQYFIDCVISYDGGCWRFTGIYGEPRTELRQKSWDALRYLRRQDDLPWLCAGDFNEACWQEEHKGKNERGWTQMEAFRDCLADCELLDLGYVGYIYTWDNKRDGEENVQVRLDRATCNDAFT